MPHAIEWSLATPKISAFLPSRSPMPALRRPRGRGHSGEDSRGYCGFVTRTSSTAASTSASVPASVVANIRRIVRPA